MALHATMNTWILTATANAPDARGGHTAVWTGSEVIVWGGYDNNFVPLNSGGRYNPATDSWIAYSLSNAPLPRDGHSAIWNGSEMIVWGGNVTDPGIPAVDTTLPRIAGQRQVQRMRHR